VEAVPLAAVRRVQMFPERGGRQEVRPVSSPVGRDVRGAKASRVRFDANGGSEARLRHPAEMVQEREGTVTPKPLLVLRDGGSGARLAGQARPFAW
jgi:hypothetical protein